MLTFTFVFFIFCHFCKCQQQHALEEVISNPINVFKRENYVFFAVSQDCTEETFQNLIRDFTFLEEKTRNGSALISDFSTYLYFGETQNNHKTFYQDTSLDVVRNCSDCFELSKVENVTESALNFITRINKNCQKEPIKHVFLIISDQCLTNLNINLNNKCPREYQHIGIILPTEKDAKNCTKELLKDVNGKYVKIYSSKNYEKYFDYFDMNVLYQTTMASSKINLFVLTKKGIRIPYAALRCKYDSIFQRFVKTGDDETLVGYFQYGNYANYYNKFIMSAPFHFSRVDELTKNYEILFTQNSSIKSADFECETIKQFLTNLNEMTLDSSKAKEQYNVLVLEDSYPICLESFKLEWKNTNRHLHIIVICNEIIKNDYSNFITFSENTLDHFSFYTNNLYDEEDKLCVRSFQKPVSFFTTPKIDDETNATTLTNVLKYTSTTEDVNPQNGLENSDTLFLTIIIIVVPSVFLLSAVSAAIIMYLNYKRKRSAKSRKILIFEKAESKISSKTKNFKNDQYWNFLLDDKEVLINYNNLLGKGSKATVYQAYHHHSLPFLSNIKVAAKVSIKNTANLIDSEFINELNSLITLQQHHNILSLIGWTMIGNDTILITELAESSLSEYLQYNRYHSNINKWSLQILWQISNALEFVADNQMIHRDVACRNILIFNKNIAKLADFGLCCKFDKNGIFKDLTHTKFPLKWLSIEALIDRKFSEKSDVWAFGVLCFEIFSHGEIPYSTISNSEIIEFLQTEKRLQKPKNVPPNIYDFMLSCWDKETQKRPSFNEIRKKFSVLLEYGYLPLENV